MGVARSLGVTELSIVEEALDVLEPTVEVFSEAVSDSQTMLLVLPSL